MILRTIDGKKIININAVDARLKLAAAALAKGQKRKARRFRREAGRAYAS